MSFDISNILENWDYHPSKVMVRRFTGKDGMEKLQLRVDLGVLQMNVNGRPDGKRPFGFSSLLEHFENQLQIHKATHDNSDEEFFLNSEDCYKLQQEAIQFHHRYISFFQLNDFEGVIRDAERNLRVFDFVDEFAETDEQAWSLQQFRPQLMLMLVKARSSQLIEEKQHDTAIQCIEQGIEDLKRFFESTTNPDLSETSNEIHVLTNWLREASEKKPLSRRERLERDLKEAVRIEDYEKAAQVRDELNGLR